MTITLHSLESLARERGTDKRAALLQSVADCFLLGEGQHAAVELSLFDEIMRMVMAEVGPGPRAELAARLALARHPPPVVLLRLANDEILVAEPILANSPALAEDELERLARELSQEHLAAIAGRARLGERVTDVLVVRGDDRVAIRVAGNDGARFSPTGFVKLADRAEVNTILRDRLAARADLPETIVERLIPMIGGPMIARIAEGLDAAPDSLLPAVPGRPLDMLLDQVARGTASLDEIVTELADSDAAVAVTELIARRTRLTPEPVVRAMFAPSEEPVTVMCRAAGFNLGAFSAVLRMRRRRRRGVARDPAQALAAFRELPVATAERVVRFLRARDLH
ncbi:MAG: DUF2336 domain-containing protein [Xanthobacteraceae bacterium]|nr:DUF2336 domain-containing protein [Xanthobacteraceae bacterium]GIK80583.1 MAG: hypothetical protein BroJett024_16880 [Alphaproteobacteria bacterium]